jgi:hypothetical protein
MSGRQLNHAIEGKEEPGPKAGDRLEDAAWPTSYDHPLDWNAQVQCGSKYMRAKRMPDQQWAQAHGAGTPISNVVVLDNRSAKGRLR